MDAFSTHDPPFKVFNSSFPLSYSILTFLAFVSSPVPASRNEYQTIKQQLEVEKIPGDNPGDPPRSFHSLSLADQAQMEKKRLQGVFYNSAVNLPFFSVPTQRIEGVELDNNSSIFTGGQTITTELLCKKN